MKVLPLSIAAMFASAGSGFLQRRLSARALAAAGASITTAGLVLMLATISSSVPYPVLAAATVLIGFGSGVFLPSNTTVILHGQPSDRLGIVNAMRLMLQNTGVVVGTALNLSIITAPLPAVLHDRVFAGTLTGGPIEQLVTGYRWALACTAVISVVNVLACLARGRRS
ncbi:hypothetical protein ACIBHX_35320 [Nonomuraea sp. NPDC050536]|uniref:hypothetical protein n=1 Tax=Nonomuraea sp. NPDC050536 TaxID=3364366 RepID=UPI0037C8DAB9